jgi:hypothetical protein
MFSTQKWVRNVKVRMSQPADEAARCRVTCSSFYNFPLHRFIYLSFPHPYLHGLSDPVFMGILIDTGVCAFIKIVGLKARWKEDVWWSIETGRYPCLLDWWPYNHFETWSRYSRHRGETNLFGIPTDWRQWTVTIGHSFLWEKVKWAGLDSIQGCERATYLALDDGFGCNVLHPIMIFTKLTGSCFDPLSTSIQTSVAPKHIEKLLLLFTS